MENQKTEQGEEIKLIITIVGRTSIERFDVEGFTAIEILGSIHEVVTTSSYVKCIDDACAGTDYHWLFYINGKAAPRSPAFYTAKRGEILEFRLARGG